MIFKWDYGDLNVSVIKKKIFVMFLIIEWVSDCRLTIQQFFSYIMAEKKLIFNDMMMRSVLFYTNMLSWIFIVLAHWNNSQRIDMLPHLDTLSWFRAKHSLLFLLNAACLAEKQQIPILLSLVWPNQGSNPLSTTLERSTLTITPPMQFRESIRVNRKDEYTRFLQI